MASAVLMTPDEDHARAVAGEVDRQLAKLPRGATVSRSLDAFGAAVVTRTLTEAVALANRFAPEHLELLVQNPRELLAGIRNAGRSFWGYTRRRRSGGMGRIPSISPRWKGLADMGIPSASGFHKKSS